MFDTELASTYLSPVRIDGSRAALADWKGDASNCTATSSTHRIHSEAPGMAIAATSTARAMSQPIMSRRRG